MNIEYFPRFKEGKLSTAFIKEIERDFAFLDREKVFRVTVEVAKSRRSVQQNRLYWLWISMIGAKTGYHKDEVHELIKFKFLKVERADPTTGEIYHTVGSTAKLNKSAFSELADYIYKWANEQFNLILPLPDSNWEQQFQNE